MLYRVPSIYLKAMMIQLFCIAKNLLNLGSRALSSSQLTNGTLNRKSNPNAYNICICNVEEFTYNQTV